jgi:hypothetical protein
MVLGRAMREVSPIGKGETVCAARYLSSARPLGRNVVWFVRIGRLRGSAQW